MEQTFYKLKDYDKAIILYACGAILSRLEWDCSGKEATFVFEDELLCLSILRKHDENKLKINSRKLVEARREITSAIKNK